MHHRRSTARFALLALLLAGSQLAAAQSAKRLSGWLLEQPAGANSYPLGLSWRVPAEEPAQQLLRYELLQDLAAQPSLRNLEEWVRSLPITGRVRVASGDPRWLATHRSRDPLLTPGQTAITSARPRTVTVVMQDGERCAVTHAGGREALAYLTACSPARAARVDWAWLVQPDGHVERYGIAPWNREAQDEPAPGAWIWAPARDSRIPEQVSDRLAQFLATQGPAPDPAGGVLELAPTTASALSLRARNATVSASDWGEGGLLQTPSARMPPAGTFGFSVSHVAPYTRGNIFFQPIDWLQAGFRYTDISNRLYGPASLSGTQTYKDKSFDAKFRLWREARYAPEIAVGFRDLAGTGLFSSEYFVGSKRFGAFDWHLGLGWGYAGGRGNLRNPFSVFSKKFDTRPTDAGQGGTPGYHSWFRGPAAFFGGVQYQTPWAPLSLKLERDGNDYQHEALGNNLPQRTPWNFGLNYRVHPSIDIRAGIERGNTLMLGLEIHPRLDEAYMPKLSDPPRVAYSLRPQRAPDWSMTSRDINAQTGWNVVDIEQAGRDLRVTLANAEGTYWADRADRAAAVLNRDAPPGIDRFTLVYRQRGLDMAEHVIDRDSWAAEQTRPIPPHEKLETLIARPPEPLPSAASLYRQAQPRFEAKLGGDFVYTLGGPDAFLLYQVALAERLRYWLREDTWIRSLIRLRLFDNYDRFHFDGPSDLPRVRTFQREYLTTSRLTVPNLQVTHAGRISSTQFYSAYAGYFEEMFGGIGGEWLYRPFGSRSAVGVDLNFVRQRDFEQDFGFRDYKVVTGHGTLYYDTGWQDVLATLAVGRYLAGDIGATLTLSRVFRNGVAIGAWATKTNVSAQQFGEGSFDKGVYLSLPLDALLTKSTAGNAVVAWRPLTRDGGAMLGRYDRLYDMTRARDPRTLWFQPADNKLETPPAPSEPYLRTPARADSAKWSADARYRHELVQALYGQGFRNIDVAYDSGRLDVRAANEEIRPRERAIGRAARTAIKHAPLETREIRIVFLDGQSAVAIYEFLDPARLDRFFNGRIDKAELASTVTVYYADASRRPADPLALLDDLSTDATPPTLPQLAAQSAPVHAVERSATDSLAAMKTMRRTNWLEAGAIAAGVVLSSSALDRRIFDSAQNHAASSSVKGLVSVGNAIPYLALGGAGLLALDDSNPVRQRTAFSAGEAGAASFIAATGIKYAFGRARPETGEGTGSFHPFATQDRHNSFPSRHAAVAWGVATPFASEYGTYWPYAIAAITTMGRAASREHWLSDAVGGSVIGYALGKVFWESGRERHKDAPRLMLSTQGIALKWDLQ